MPLEMEEMGQQQAGRPGSDDPHLRAHRQRPLATRSGVEEHGFVLALKMNVERVSRLAGPASGNKGRARILRHQRQDRIARVGGFIGEIDARKQPLEQAAREDADIDVRRLSTAVRAWNRARLHRREAIAALAVARRSAQIP